MEKNENESCRWFKSLSAILMLVIYYYWNGAESKCCLLCHLKQTFAYFILWKGQLYTMTITIQYTHLQILHFIYLVGLDYIRDRSTLNIFNNESGFDLVTTSKFCKLIFDLQVCPWFLNIIFSPGIMEYYGIVWSM